MLACGISLTFSILFFLFALVFFLLLPPIFFRQSDVDEWTETLITTIAIITKKQLSPLVVVAITHVYYELLDYRVVASFVPDGWIFENDFHAYVYSLEQSAVTALWCLVIRVSFVCRGTDFLSFVFSFFFPPSQRFGQSRRDTRWHVRTNYRQKEKCLFSVLCRYPTVFLCIQPFSSTTSS